MLAVLLLAAATQFTWMDAGGGRTELRDAKGPVLVYNHGPQLAEGAPAGKKRCCYVHPLYAPNGAVVTDDFPQDHWHHRGVFWAWPIVRAGGKQYDLWMMGGGIEKRFLQFLDRRQGDTATLRVENGWFADGKQILTERVMIYVPRSGDANMRRIEFTFEFEALKQPVELQGAPEEDKGYGGFSVRFAPRTGTEISTDVGVLASDSNMEPHPYVALAAEYQGKKAAVYVRDDPDNPGYPNGWCIRHYGFLGVNYPGRKPLRIEPGKRLQLRYTIEVHNR